MTGTPRFRTRELLPIVALVLAACAVLPVLARPQSGEKQVIVSVMDLRMGRPAPGVTAAALALKEDGKDREILKVEPATAPMSVVLLADTTSAFTRYVPQLRAAAQGFLTAFAATHKDSAISLWTFGGAGVPVTGFETDIAKPMEEAGKLRPMDIVARISGESGSNLLEGVVDAAKALAKRPETRRVIVSFNAATPLEASKVTKSLIQSELQKAGASWFAVTFADGGSSSSLRDSIMTEVLPMSGGLRLNIDDAARLEANVKALADILTAQYVVTYSRPSGSAKEVAIAVKGEGLRAFYHRWAPK